MADLAAVMGYRIFPWQQALFDIALERDADGKYAYPIVGQALARQQSKTFNLSLRIGLELQRANGRVLYTSTDRGLAVERWHEICSVLLHSGFKPHIDAMKMTNGDERLICHNGATFKPVTPTARAAGRGQSAVSLVVVDEAAQMRDFGALSAILPTQMVVPSSQLWIASNAGKSALEAPVWAHYTELGRGAVEKPDASVAWFEWAPDYSDPDAFDPSDPANWREAMPMLAAGLVSEASVRELFVSMPTDDFTRECLNLWGQAQGAAVIDPTDWAACVRDDVEVDGNSLSLAMDVAPNGEAASISAATLYPGDELTPALVAVEVIDSRAGTQWLVARVCELARKYRPDAIYVDAGSPAGGFADHVEAQGVPVERLTGREFAQACQQVATVIHDRTLCHMDQAPLNEAVAGAIKRQYGDLWAWNRRRGHNISPLCSATMAVAGVLATPRPKVPAIW